MTRGSVQPRDRVFVSRKYSQKLLDHAKEFSTDALKTASKRAVQKTAEATGDLIGNTIALKQQSQKIYHIIIQKQLQINKKDIYISIKKIANY